MWKFAIQQRLRKILEYHLVQCKELLGVIQQQQLLCIGICIFMYYIYIQLLLNRITAH